LTIAIVFEVFLPIVNGVVTTTINLAENLKKLGHRVIFIVPAWNAFSEPYINNIPIFYIRSIKSHMYPGLRFVSPWDREVKKILINENVEILHITGPWLLSLAAMKIAKTNKIPVIQVFHTLLYEDKYLYYLIRCWRLVPLSKRLAWKYFGLFVKYSDVITAPSNHACQILKSKYPKSIIKHILNGINLSDFENYSDYATLSANYNYFNHKTFLFVGRLGEEKSVSILLKAFQLAYQKDQELRLFIVGDGPGREEYEKTVKINSMDNSVFFLGRIPHKELLRSGLYHHCRALVTASITENQPMTVLEAIACNTPIIIPDVEGINELLDGNGISFSANNITDFADAMIRIAQDNVFYDHCTHAGQKWRERFDGMLVAKQFEKLYMETSNTLRNEKLF